METGNAPCARREAWSLPQAELSACGTQKLRDNWGLWGTHGPVHWPVLAWPPPSRWPALWMGMPVGSLPRPRERLSDPPPRSQGTFLINVKQLVGVVIARCWHSAPSSLSMSRATASPELGQGHSEQEP